MLQNIDDATLGHIVVVWPSSVFSDSRYWLGRPTGHIYQFGLINPVSMDRDLPQIEPLCGAPGYERIDHCNLPDSKEWGDCCISCLVTLVSGYPHLFMKGGT